MGKQIDFAALSDPTAGAIRRRWRLKGTVATWPMWTGIAIILALPLPVWAIVLAVSPDPMTVLFVLLWLHLPLSFIVIVALGLWYWSRGSMVDSVESRLPEFAAANGLIYSGYDGAPNYPGGLFSAGTLGRATDHIRTPQDYGSFFDVGSFEYEIPSGKGDTATVTSGFIAIGLDRRLPHIVLKAEGNRGGMNEIPIGIDTRQVQSLEGDFDRYFTLYSPADYGADALYIFTPDLMALLIDEASAFDVEIIDDWMFIYSPNSFTDAPADQWERLFRIIDVVGAKTLRQTARYADERMPRSAGIPQQVSARGSRLRHGASSLKRTYRNVYIAVFGVTAGYVVVGTLTGVMYP